jgi:4-amino-4-deoxy-L-arabinose transferase-like glycosyltransferase
LTPGSPQRGRIAGVWFLLAILVVVWLAAAWWARSEFLPYDVNNTDVGTYLFQAETFASGHLARLTPEPREFFSQWQAIVRDRSFAYYPPLPAVAMALPIAFGGSPFLVPWLSSGLALVLTFIWIRRLAGKHAAWFGTLALAVSPFFVANGLSVLSHAFTLLLTVAFLVVVERWQATGSRRWAVVAGALLAAVFASRPVNALALGIAWVPWAAASPTPRNAGQVANPPRLWRGRQLPIEERKQQGFMGVAGFAALFVPLALYYYELAGRWTLSLFTDYWPRNRFGFGQGLGRGEPGHYFQTFADHNLDGFLRNLRYSAEGLATWWTGNVWLSAVLLGLVGILLVLRIGNRISSIGNRFWPLLAWPAAHVFLYAGYFTPSTPTTGPRYLAELMPLLALATGWGVARLATGGAAVRRLALLLFAFAMVVSVQAVVKFLRLNQIGIPARRAVEHGVAEGARAPAVVFLRSFWIGHPLPIFRNLPGLSGPVIFACDRGAEDRRLVERYPGRNAYILALFPEGRVVRAELVPVYRASDRRWLRAPELVEAPFFVGSRFTPPLRLEGEVARKLFYPRAEEIEEQ